MSIIKTKNRYLYGTMFQTDHELGSKFGFFQEAKYYDADSDGKDDATGAGLKGKKVEAGQDPNVEYKTVNGKPVVVTDTDGKPKLKQQPGVTVGDDKDKGIGKLITRSTEAATDLKTATADLIEIQKIYNVYKNTDASKDISGEVRNKDLLDKIYGNLGKGVENRQLTIQDIDNAVKNFTAIKQAAIQGNDVATKNLTEARKELDPESNTGRQAQAALDNAVAAKTQADAAAEQARVALIKADYDREVGLAQSGRTLTGVIYQTQMGLTQGWAKAKTDAEYQTYNMVEQASRDPLKDKFPAIINKRIFDNLDASELTPTKDIPIPSIDANGKSQVMKIAAYSSIRVGPEGVNRETPGASKFSDFGYYYIPESAIKDSNLTKNGDYVNVDMNSPLVSKVSRLAVNGTDGKLDHYDYVDNKTHKILTNDEKKRLFTGGAVSGKAMLQQGRGPLDNYFMPAEEIEELHNNQSLGNGAQSIFGALGKKIPNENLRREASEILEGFLGGQMNLIQLIGKVILLIKASKDYKIGGKQGRVGSLEDIKTYNATEQDVSNLMSGLSSDDQKATGEIVGQMTSLKGMSEKDFNKKLDDIKTSLKKNGVSDETIEIISASAHEGYRKQAEENRLKLAQDEVSKSDALKSLKDLITNTDKETHQVKTTVKGKKVTETVIDDLLTGKDEDIIKSLFAELEKKGITTLKGVDFKGIDMSKISNIKAVETAPNSGVYKVQFFDAANKPPVKEFELN